MLSNGNYHHEADGCQILLIIHSEPQLKFQQSYKYINRIIIHQNSIYQQNLINYAEKFLKKRRKKASTAKMLHQKLIKYILRKKRKKVGRKGVVFWEENLIISSPPPFTVVCIEIYNLEIRIYNHISI